MLLIRVERDKKPINFQASRTFEFFPGMLEHAPHFGSTRRAGEQVNDCCNRAGLPLWTDEIALRPVFARKIRSGTRQWESRSFNRYRAFEKETSIDPPASLPGGLGGTPLIKHAKLISRAGVGPNVIRSLSKMTVRSGRASVAGPR